jgi:hypothetical protein
MKVKCWIRIIIPEYRPHSIFCVNKTPHGWGDHEVTQLHTDKTPYLFDTEEAALAVIDEIRPTYSWNIAFLTVVTRVIL